MTTPSARTRCWSGLERARTSWAEPEITELGALIGSPELEELARAANTYVPTLHTHDRFGRRLDRVEFHPAYHELMRLSYASRVHSLPWVEDRPGSQVARAAISYLWNQGENGIGCLNVMSYSIVPLLRANPEVGRDWEPGVLSSRYDARHLPAHQKSGLTVAMSMTEKQGGSDLRRNDTRATPTGSGREYVLRGHKFFCSAPMGDVILLTARTDNGVSLFLAPRLLPDGSHNGTFIQRLKDKLGNRSNASSEIEIDGTVAYLLGEEGHGIREFIQHMTHYIRMDFAVASTGIVRRALVLAAQHVRHRDAFGQRIADLPQMRNVLADLALEWEASLLLGLRMADALDKAPHSPHDHDLLRIGVPVAKFWNCRRVNHVVLEALECHGGMGYVEEQSIARLLREAPLNSIWEGTAAMMGLDLVRALRRHPESKDALLAEIHAGTSGDHRLRALASTLAQDIERAGPDLEAHARRVMGTAAVGLQASLLNRFAPAEVADLFIASRIDRHGGVELGTLPVHGPQLARIAERRSRLTTYIRARTPSYPVLARPRRPPARRASSLRPRTLALPAFRRSHAVRASNFRNSLPIGTWRSAIAAKKCRARYSSRDRQHVYIRVDLRESLNNLLGVKRIQKTGYVDVIPRIMSCMHALSDISGYPA